MFPFLEITNYIFRFASQVKNNVTMDSFIRNKPFYRITKNQEIIKELKGLPCAQS